MILSKPNNIWQHYIKICQRYKIGKKDKFLIEIMNHSDDDSFDDHLQDDIVKNVLESGQDLRDYSKQIEQELVEREQVSIDDYISQAGNIAQLYNQISSCDGILERMENMLLTFQTDLGSISSEILSLQHESVEMNLRLKNRQSVR